MSTFISWVEIPATDFDRAVNFYNMAFGLDLEKNDYGTEKMACFPGGEGAISLAPDFKPSENGVLVSLNTGAKLEQALQAIEKSGGQIVQPKTKIEAEGRGYFATFIDSEGNKVGLYGEV